MFSYNTDDYLAYSAILSWRSSENDSFTSSNLCRLEYK